MDQPPPDFFNVFATAWEAMDAELWGDDKAEGRVLYEAPDRTLIAVASRYPDGVTFTFGATVDFPEVFYVVAGEGSRTFPDGRTVPMRAGDFIFNRPGQDVTYVYGPGFIDIAIFWDTKPLPEMLTSGLASGLRR